MNGRAIGLWRERSSVFRAVSPASRYAGYGNFRIVRQPIRSCCVIYCRRRLFGRIACATVRLVPANPLPAVARDRPAAATATCACFIRFALSGDRMRRRAQQRECRRCRVEGEGVGVAALPGAGETAARGRLAQLVTVHGQEPAMEKDRGLGIGVCLAMTPDLDVRPEQRPRFGEEALLVGRARTCDRGFEGLDGPTVQGSPRKRLRHRSASPKMLDRARLAASRSDRLSPWAAIRASRRARAACLPNPLVGKDDCRGSGSWIGDMEQI